MTIIPYQDTGELNQTTKTVIWSNVTGGDEGQPIDLSNYPDKTIQVIGPTFSGAVTIEGSNDETNYATLTDNIGLPLSFTAVAMKYITENPKLIKPAVAAGTSANTIIITATK